MCTAFQLDRLNSTDNFCNEEKVDDFEWGLAEDKNLVHAIVNTQNSKTGGKFLQQLHIYWVLNNISAHNENK
jgi:hypothetical protein